MSDTQGWIRKWMAEVGHADAAAALAATDDFLAGGTLDSFDIIQLVSAIEQAFGVAFDPEDFQKPEFATIAGLAGVVDGHRGKTS